MYPNIASSPPCGPVEFPSPRADPFLATILGTGLYAEMDICEPFAINGIYTEMGACGLIAINWLYAEMRVLH